MSRDSWPALLVAWVSLRSRCHSDALSVLEAAWPWMNLRCDRMPYPFGLIRWCSRTAQCPTRRRCEGLIRPPWTVRCDSGVGHARAVGCAGAVAFGAVARELRAAGFAFVPLACHFRVVRWPGDVRMPRPSRRPPQAAGAAHPSPGRRGCQPRLRLGAREMSRARVCYDKMDHVCFEWL